MEPSETKLAKSVTDCKKYIREEMAIQKRIWSTTKISTRKDGENVGMYWEGVLGYRMRLYYRTFSLTHRPVIILIIIIIII